MRKLVIIVSILIILLTFNTINLDEKIIPNESIRFRILANSNSNYDQYIKTKVRDKLQKEMYSLLSGANHIDEARNIIKTNMTNFSNQISNVLNKENYQLEYTINYGDNYFPTKDYDGETYSAGNYESLLVTLGDGRGDNWWCILFPPLCLLEAKKSTKVEYKSFIKELINKIFK